MLPVLAPHPVFALYAIDIALGLLVPHEQSDSDSRRERLRPMPAIHDAAQLFTQARGAFVCARLRVCICVF